MREEAGFSPKERILFLLVSLLGSALIWLLGKSWRITFIGQENVEKVWKQGKKVLYSFWHGRLLAPAYSHRRQGIRILISQHRDGEFIARIVERLGYVPARGSSSRGGARAILEMVKASQNFNIAITPDGPKGPRHQVQPGAAYLASRAGVPLLPLTSSASSAWVLNSWDRFMIPKPFSRVLISVGEPIWLSPKASTPELEQKSKQLEEKLLDLTAQADRYFNSD